jgi:hypothetical protein
MQIKFLQIRQLLQITTFLRWFCFYCCDSFYHSLWTEFLICNERNKFCLSQHFIRDFRVPPFECFSNRVLGTCQTCCHTTIQVCWLLQLSVLSRTCTESPSNDHNDTKRYQRKNVVSLKGWRIWGKLFTFYSPNDLPNSRALNQPLYIYTHRHTCVCVCVRIPCHFLKILVNNSTRKYSSSAPHFRMLRPFRIKVSVHTATSLFTAKLSPTWEGMRNMHATSLYLWNTNFTRINESWL